ncbi:MAG TPA: hypothetical protein PLP17_04340 [Oligoflexia bacterium]|nr:hypothetical protein [Oligoflexia bacterium]
MCKGSSLRKAFQQIGHDASFIAMAGMEELGRLAKAGSLDEARARLDVIAGGATDEAISWLRQAIVQLHGQAASEVVGAEDIALILRALRHPCVPELRLVAAELLATDDFRQGAGDAARTVVTWLTDSSPHETWFWPALRLLCAIGGSAVEALKMALEQPDQILLQANWQGERKHSVEVVRNRAGIVVSMMNPRFANELSVSVVEADSHGQSPGLNQAMRAVFPDDSTDAGKLIPLLGSKAGARFALPWLLHLGMETQQDIRAAAELLNEAWFRRETGTVVREQAILLLALCGLQFAPEESNPALSALKWLHDTLSLSLEEHLQEAVLAYVAYNALSQRSSTPIREVIRSSYALVERTTRTGGLLRAAA